jgi:putative oxidoreductase
MWKKLVQTENDYAALVLRVLLGAVFFPHGAQKVLGWFGGYGLSGTYGMFTEKLGIPGLFALLAIAAEFLGAIGLVVGLLTRVAAFGIMSVMVVAVYMMHWQNGFFMNWFGAVTKEGKAVGEGFEFHLLVIAMAVALIIKGGGALSADKAIADKL